MGAVAQRLDQGRISFERISDSTLVMHLSGPWHLQRDLPPISLLLAELGSRPGSKEIASRITELNQHRAPNNADTKFRFRLVTVYQSAKRTPIQLPGEYLMEKKMKTQCIRQRHRSGIRIALAIAALPVLLMAGTSRGQDIYIYPAKGQSQTQQDRDRYECHSWSVKQTGFDPSRSQAVASDPRPASNQPLPAQGHIVRGAGRGAALGAVGGAITGNAGTGAAAGAAMGGLAGGMRRRQQKLQQNQQQQQATSQATANSQQSQRNAYNRAMAACLTGRGYTVN
jgi:hypothetical protein